MKALIQKFKEVMNTKNVGVLDRVLRITTGLVLIGLGIYNHASLGLAIAFSLLGINVAMTGIRGVCSIYYLLGYSTCPMSHKPNLEQTKK